MWKIWPTVCSSYAARDTSESAGPTASLNDNQSSVRVSLASMITRGLLQEDPHALDAWFFEAGCQVTDANTSWVL